MYLSPLAQFCPQFKNAALTAMGTTCARSASPQTTNASFPPSSSVTGVTRGAAAAITFDPTSVDPTNTILSTPPATSAAPASP
jgi:hypothetical protein